MYIIFCDHFVSDIVVDFIRISHVEMCYLTLALCIMETSLVKFSSKSCVHSYLHKHTSCIPMRIVHIIPV